jgi:hypothetical protein
MRMATWRVVRQDDNGNCYVIAGDLSRAEAEALARMYEARAHKQIYFLEEQLPPLSADPSSRSRGTSSPS